nr:transposase [Salinibacter ruber]
MAQRQSNNADPTFADEEVLKTATASYVFGLIKKRKTISEIHEYVGEHFSEWFPDLPSYQSFNRRPGRLSAVFAPLVEETLSEVVCEKTQDDIIRIADSMPTRVAKGQRASQAEVASDRLASVGYCSSKCVSFHGVKLHLVVERRSERLPIPERAGLTPGSENDLRALRRVLPTIEGGVLCGDKACCDGPLKEGLAEDQNLDLLTPAREGQGPEDPPSGR